MSIESTYPLGDLTLDHTPHFWEYLTQSELQALFALSFISTSSDYSDSYPIRRYLDGGDEGDWTSLTRASARYLALEHGYLFSGIRIDLNHSIHEERVVEPRNIISVMQGKAGRIPIHPLAALSNTVEWVRDRIPSLNTDPILATIADIKESLKSMREAIGEEQLREEAELRMKARGEFMKEGKEGGWVQ